METIKNTEKKVALVTGSAACIGLACAQAFAKAGYITVLADINEPKEQAAYIACKHAVIGLTRTAAIDYAAKGIHINAVCPGVIRTPMAEELIRRNPALEKELVRDIPAGRLGRPEEIANAVLWLCGPTASFVDGHALLVDGAFTIH